MSKKKSASKTLARTAKAATRETKKQASNFVKNIKATGKLVKAITKRAGGKPSKKTTASKASTKSKQQKQQPSRKPKSSASQSPKHSKVVPGQDSYKLTELATGRNLAQLFSNLEANASEIDKLKPSGARWAFRIMDRNSLAVYRSMHQVVNRLEASGGLHEVKGIQNNINFLTVGGTPKEYQDMRQGEQQELKRQNAATLREVKKTVGKTKTRTYTSKNDLLRDLLQHDKQQRMERERAEKRATEADQRLQQAEKRIQELEKRAAKLIKQGAKKANATAKKAAKKSAKKSTKKAAKKSTPKKSSTKKAPAKSSKNTRRTNANGKRGAAKKYKKK